MRRKLFGLEPLDSSGSQSFLKCRLNRIQYFHGGLKKSGSNPIRFTTNGPRCYCRSISGRRFNNNWPVNIVLPRTIIEVSYIGRAWAFIISALEVRSHGRSEIKNFIYRNSTYFFNTVFKTDTAAGLDKHRHLCVCVGGGATVKLFMRLAP